MSVQQALLEFSNALAEQGVMSDAEVRLGRDAWRMFVGEVAMLSRFMAAPIGTSDVISLYGPSGTIAVRPADPRDAKCPHGIPWDYCTPCGERANG